MKLQIPGATFLKCGMAAAAVVTILQGRMDIRLDRKSSSATSATVSSRLDSNSTSDEARTQVKQATEQGSPLTSAPPASRHASSLRFDWSNLPPISRLGRAMQAHQSNCTLPLGDLKMRNLAGLGSDLHLWTQALCNGMQEGARVQTRRPWIFRYRSACRGQDGATAMQCYFPRAELRCPDDRAALRRPKAANRTRLYVDNGRVLQECGAIREQFNASFSDVRAAGVEYLFSQTGSVVIEEAERQLARVFGEERPPPSQLITVHIRWGDKSYDMELRPIQEYIDAVQSLANNKNLTGQEVNVFLASEDPLAIQGFQEAAKPLKWKVFLDAYYQEFSLFRDPGPNGNPHMSKNLQGRPGLVALASVLIALQANDFVLTTRSNWSRLLNELRKNVLDPRCDSCTRMIDLTQTFFEW